MKSLYDYNYVICFEKQFTVLGNYSLIPREELFRIFHTLKSTLINFIFVGSIAERLEAEDVSERTLLMCV